MTKEEREEAIKLIENIREKFLNKYGEETTISIPIDGDDIRAFDTALEALKQEPKQVELEGDGYAYGTDEIVYDSGRCPICGWEFEEGNKDWEEPYCCHCGQKLEWFDNEAESEG